MAIQIIQENRRPSSFDKFSQLVGQGVELGTQNLMSRERKNAQELQNRQENSRLRELGFDVEGLNPELKKEVVSRMLQGRQQENLQQQKYGFENELEGIRQEGISNKENQKYKSELNKKANPLKTGLKTLQEMKRIVGNGRLGVLSSVGGFFSDKTRQDRAKYSQLGKSLISLASTIPIRNKTEFETLANDLHDPNNTDAYNNGILQAMQEILTRGLQELESGESESNQESLQQTQNKRPLSSFRKG